MKTLNLEFDTADLQLKPEAGVVPGAVELSRRIINVVIMQYSEQRGGFIKAERGQAYWLREALEKAAATEAKTIDIPDDVFGFLRKVFREVKMPPDRILQMVEQRLDEVKYD
jgi:hypothetical protein